MPHVTISSTISSTIHRRRWFLPPSCTNYWRKHWSAELQGAAVTCYIPAGGCHDECDTMLCSKFRLQIKTGPNHCNLVIFFSFSRNLEHCRVPHAFIMAPPKIKNRTRPLQFVPIFFIYSRHLEHIRVMAAPSWYITRHCRSLHVSA